MKKKGGNEMERRHEFMPGSGENETRGGEGKRAFQYGTRRLVILS
jgi:hypothetical protein